MKYKVGLIALSLLVIFFTYNPISSAKSQSNEVISPSYTYQLSTNSQDSTFRDLYDDKEYSFELMPYWIPRQVMVQLDYNTSQLADSNTSSVNLSINGKPFFSFHPKVSKNTSTVQHIAVVIPGQFIHEGTNTLRINSEINEKNMDRICRTDSTNDWLTVYKTSLVRAVYKNESFSEHINDFFKRFSGVDTMTNHDSVIAVSDQATNSELRAAAYSLIGVNKIDASYPNSANHGISIDQWSSRLLKDKHWIVLISEYNHLPNDIKRKISSRGLRKAALIKIVTIGNKHIAVVTSMNRNKLTKGAKLIANSSLLKQIKSTTTYVNNQTVVKTENKKTSINQKIVTSSDQVVGPFHHEKNYYFSIPINQNLAAGSQVHLQLRYAQNLDFNRSLVTVSINNTPIGSHKLSREKANSDLIDFIIPKDIQASGSYTVTVSYDLEMDGLKCAPIGSKTPWAMITPQSFIRIYTNNEQNKLFQSYPFPFLKDGRLNQLAVVLPSKKNEQIYAALSNALSLIGKYAQTNSGNLNFYGSEVNKQILHNKNIITLGAYSNNALIRKINNKLFYKYDHQGNGFLSNEKMTVDRDYGKSIGTLQLIDSPFSNQNSILVITAPQAVDMEMASNKISSEAELFKISGDGVFVDRDNHVQANRYKKLISDSNDSSNLFSKIKSNSGSFGFLSLVCLMFLTLLIVIFLLIWKYKKGDDVDNEKK